MLSTRAATSADLPAIVSATRAQRRQLALWSPVYFNPRAGADAAHAGWLEFIVGSADHDTAVALDGNDPIAFYVRIPQDRHTWIDDLCITEPERWPQVLELIAETNVAPWVTCVSAHDEPRREAMTEVGLAVISTYWVRSTADITPRPAPTTATTLDVGTTPGPHHTFGGSAFSPDAPGALVVTDGDDGYAVGSPSASPPIYDPGGPSCVIDQIVGRDRTMLLDQALAAAAARGDAQVIVVSGHDDIELSDITNQTGFTAEVLLMGM